MKTYDAVDKQKIHLKAQRLLGKKLKSDAQDRADFMDECINQLVDSGEYEDEDDARTVCELIWDETGDY